MTETPEPNSIGQYYNGVPITIWPPTTIKQTARERLEEAIRLGGMQWHRENNPNWRDKPWKDGIRVDLDEADVVARIAQYIIDLADPDDRSQNGENGDE